MKRPLADTDWHIVVLLGGGYVNVCAHGHPLGVRDFTVRLLDDPTKEDLRRMRDPNYKPKTFVDGTGKVMSL